MRNEEAADRAPRVPDEVPIVGVDSLAMLKEAIIEGFRSYVDPQKGRVRKEDVVEYVNELIERVKGSPTTPITIGEEPDTEPLYAYVDRYSIDAIVPKAGGGSSVILQDTIVHSPETTTAIVERQADGKDFVAVEVRREESAKKDGDPA